MTEQMHTLVAWLRDAHAMERATVDTLDHLAERLTRRYPELAARFRQHWQESLSQVERIETCLKELGSDSFDLRKATENVVLKIAYDTASSEMSAG